MGLFESLPDRPLKRSEIAQLEQMDAVGGVYPVYDELNPNTAHGLVILLNGTLHAWARRDEWVAIDEKEIEEGSDGDTQGIPIDESSTLNEFQDAIAEEIGAVM